MQDSSFIEIECPGCHSRRAVYDDDPKPIRCYSCNTELSVESAQTARGAPAEPWAKVKSPKRRGLRFVVIGVLVLIILVVGVVMSLALNLGQSPSDKEISAGIRYLNAGGYAEAVEHLKEALKLKPDSAQAHYWAGVAYHFQYLPQSESRENKKMAEMAKVHYREVLNQRDDKIQMPDSFGNLRAGKDSVHTATLLELGVLFRKTEQFDESLSYLKQAAKAAPSDARAWQQIATTIGHMCEREILDKSYEESSAKGPRKYVHWNKEISTRGIGSLRQKLIPLIDEGISSSENAWRGDPLHLEEVRKARSTLFSIRSSLAETQQESDDWLQKALR